MWMNSSGGSTYYSIFDPLNCDASGCKVSHLENELPLTALPGAHFYKKIAKQIIKADCLLHRF